jgi:hypothetical protein
MLSLNLSLSLRSSPTLQLPNLIGNLDVFASRREHVEEPVVVGYPFFAQ